MKQEINKQTKLTIIYIPTINRFLLVSRLIKKQ